jgi:hypothetical protein
MMNEAKYLLDIRSLVDSIEYGVISIPVIRRVNNKTVEVTTSSVETVVRETLKDYQTDIILFLNALTKNEHSGKVTLELEWKNGTIRTLGYHTETKTEYRK